MRLARSWSLTGTETTTRLFSAITCSSLRRGLPPAAEDGQVGAPAPRAAVRNRPGAQAGRVVQVGSQPFAQEARPAAGHDPPGDLRAEAVEANLVHAQPGPLLSGG